MPFGKGRPSGRSRELKKTKTLIYALCLLTLSFAGCGYSPTQSANKAANNGVGSLDPRDLASPPGPQDGITVETPPIAGQINAPQDVLSQAGTFEPRPGGMMGALGVNLDTYFAEDIQDPIERIKRLERAVIAIQRDLKTVAPPIQRLVSVESDIQELVTQLQVLLENDSQPSASPLPAVPVPKAETAAMASPTPQLADASGAASDGVERLSPEKQATPPPAPPPEPVSTPPPITPAATQTGPPLEAQPPPQPSETKEAIKPAVADRPSVTDLRVGDHPDKVRLVLDLTANAAYTADIDNEEHILVIELPEAGWGAAAEKTFNSSPLLKSYKVEANGDGKGSMLIVQLRKASGIVSQQKLDGEEGEPPRIVIDLKK